MFTYPFIIVGLSFPICDWKLYTSSLDFNFLIWRIFWLKKREGNWNLYHNRSSNMTVSFKSDIVLSVQNTTFQIILACFGLQVRRQRMQGWGAQFTPCPCFHCDRHEAGLLIVLIIPASCDCWTQIDTSV